jgi:hypothetical protein
VSEKKRLLVNPSQPPKAPIACIGAIRIRACRKRRSMSYRPALRLQKVHSTEWHLDPLTFLVACAKMLSVLPAACTLSKSPATAALLLLLSLSCASMLAARVVAEIAKLIYGSEQGSSLPAHCTQDSTDANSATLSAAHRLSSAPRLGIAIASANRDGPSSTQASIFLAPSCDLRLCGSLYWSYA